MNRRSGVDDEALLEVAQRIADGKRVDWSEIAHSMPDGVALQLKRLNAIAGSRRLARVENDPIPQEPRRRFAHLELVEEIGGGVTGVVYRAYDPMLDRVVALKLISLACDRPETLLREAQLMARVDHPNVLKVHGAALYEGKVGFWSDLIEGESLADLQCRQGTVDAIDIVSIGLELCAALSAIHAADLVHGDLKPSNVIRHQSGRWVVIDFGSTLLTGNAGCESGTPLYLGPEHLLDPTSTATAQSDLYSLGVVLFHLATGEFPVEAESLAHLVQSHRLGAPKRLLDVRPAFPEPLVDAIDRCLSVNACDRFATADDCAEALRFALGSHQFRGLRRWTALSATALLFLIVATFIATRFLPAGPELEVHLYRHQAQQSIELRDGDTVSTGQQLSLAYSNTKSAHVYIVDEDALGESFQLFPLVGAALTNPLPAGQAVHLPGSVDGQEVDWQVTSHGGRERIFVIVSPSAVPEFEAFGLPGAKVGQPLDGDRQRSIGGLLPRNDGALSKFEIWLQSLVKKHPELKVRRYELRNL